MVLFTGMTQHAVKNLTNLSRFHINYLHRLACTETDSYLLDNASPGILFPPTKQGFPETAFSNNFLELVSIEVRFCKQ